jgi:hypothetical protein
MNISKYDFNARLNDKIKKICNNNLIKHYARMCLSRFHIKQLLFNQLTVGHHRPVEYAYKRDSCL